MEKARLISVVPQALKVLPSLSVWDTVLTGRTPHLNWLGQMSENDKNIAVQAMQRTDTLELSNRRVNQLSGGEQQRTLLARALTQSTPIMLMDEPTAHLDLQHQVNILNYVRSLARIEGLSVIIAMHDLNIVARYADEIALLVDGAIRAVGAPEMILEPGLLSEVYNIPLKVFTIGRDKIPFIFPEANE